MSDPAILKDPKTGRLLPGCKAGPGRPKNAGKNKSLALHNALMRTVTKQDMTDIVTALLKRARKGNIQAAREIFDRVLGKAKQHIELDSTGNSLFTSIEQRNLLIQLLNPTPLAPSEEVNMPLLLAAGPPNMANMTLTQCPHDPNTPTNTTITQCPHDPLSDPVVLDAPVDQGPISDATPHPAVRTDGPEPVPGQQP